MKLLLIIVLSVFVTKNLKSQAIDTIRTENKVSDSIYIEEFEKKKPVKVLHAEPLYIDLIRDLGARKGESEWNVGVGLTDNNKFDKYTALVEYEFAPVDRLGLEVEVPFTFYYPINGSADSDSMPGSKLNSLKLAGQYSFFVSERLKTSMAIGYIHEFELTEFSRYGKEPLTKGNVFDPFFVAAKRWGSNFHSLIYTGPSITHHYKERNAAMSWQINTNFHYMISGTRNFISVEFNKETAKRDFDMTIRPELRLGIAENLLIGIVTGIPIRRENERFSSFVRLIYEPKNKH